MIGTSELVPTILDLLAADAGTLGPAVASENKLRLVTADFTPARTLVFGDLTYAAWTGSAPKTVTGGAQQVGYDTVRQEWFIELVPPVGGWYWECTAAPAETVNNFGVALVDNAGAVLLGTQKLPVVVQVSAIGHTVQVGTVRFYESDLLLR